MNPFTLLLAEILRVRRARARASVVVLDLTGLIGRVPPGRN